MRYDILSYGAVADGATLCTVAIQAAIDACHQNGGGTVEVPAGTFKTGTLWLKSHVELHLCHGATLLASEDLDDYNAEDAYVQNYRSNEEEWCGKHLIIAHEQTDVSITGHGKIDGNGHLFYGEPEKRWNFLWKDGLALSRDKERLRPGQVIVFVQCSHVRVQDIRMENTTCWNILFHGCEFVQVRGVVIQNPTTYANTDGIDIDTSRFVTVSDCIIDTADDAFAIRGAGHRLIDPPEACEHVTITNWRGQFAHSPRACFESDGQALCHGIYLYLELQRGAWDVYPHFRRDDRKRGGGASAACRKICGNGAGQDL